MPLLKIFPHASPSPEFQSPRQPTISKDHTPWQNPLAWLLLKVRVHSEYPRLRDSPLAPLQTLMGPQAPTKLAFPAMMMPMMTPKRPSADAKISTTRILTKRVALAASDRAALLPTMPTLSLDGAGEQVARWVRGLGRARPASGHVSGSARVLR